jgi:hypothetical protein
VRAFERAHTVGIDIMSVSSHEGVRVSAPSLDRAIAFLEAVVAIWQHTEQHTEYVEGVGYTSRSDQQHLVCVDPEEHARLAAAEGKAWHEYRANTRPVEIP